MRSRPLTTAEAAAELGQSPQTVRRLAANGTLDAEKVGRDWQIAPESVAALAPRSTELRQALAEVERLEPDIAHPASFHRHLAQIEREDARSRTKIPRQLARQAGYAINAAVARGAFSPDRIDFWAGQVILAGSEAEAEEAIGTINSLWGTRGPAPGADAEGDYDEGQFRHLWPPEAGEEREWRAARDAAGQEAMAASARRRAREGEDFLVLFPPESPEEADRQAAVRERIAASARQAADLDEDDDAGYEGYASLLPPQRHRWDRRP